jgi:formylglycine-generating enzyme required for sulfatase activity
MQISGLSPKIALWRRLPFISAFLLFACIVSKEVQAQTQATAEALVVNGFVVSINVTSGGSGYGDVPEVQIVGGGGAGAVAVAVVQSGAVSHIIVQAAGSGYTSKPEVIIAAPVQDLATQIRLVPMLTFQGVPGQSYELQFAPSLDSPVVWRTVQVVTSTRRETDFFDRAGVLETGGFYRLKEVSLPTQARIPAGEFEMGDTLGDGLDWEKPVHSVFLDAFDIDTHEVTFGFWTSVKEWGLDRGYTFVNEGAGQGADHPVQTVSWYDAIKWCNARSEREGLEPVYYADSDLTTVIRMGESVPRVKWSANGYRLPTEAEFEKAARGGLEGKRFPWGDIISHDLANYLSYLPPSYDAGAGGWYHPDYRDLDVPFTAPVGSFAPNGYGVFDMSGNVWEWCWDFAGAEYYAQSPANNPRGPNSGTTRILRGGSWGNVARECRVAWRYEYGPTAKYYYGGFRCARTP